jgi:HSP20 family protein
MKALSRWRPFEAISWPFSRDLNEMFRRFVDEDGGQPIFDWKPAADLLETADAFVIKVEAPGMKADDIQVSLTGDTLTIKGEKRQEEKREEDNWHFVERSFGAFQRTFILPGVVSPDQIDARFKDGILEVKLLKSKESKTKKITVKA